MNIEALQRDYANARLTPTQLVEDLFSRIESTPLNPVWIAVVPKADALARAAALATQDAAKLPLYGIPFAVKDNIDVAGMATTAACPAYSYVPGKSATVVEKLEAAGAILIGKTNMDQFATGLVGTRSPYGACSSVFSQDHISGGSSAGSAVAVANGLVSFSLGTDTAGSGRVPAMFNNLIGLKPTRGVLSTQGVVPACRTLDCVSIFAENAADAAAVLAVARGFDEQDPYSRQASFGSGASPWAAADRFRFGVPKAEQLQFFGDAHNPALFDAAVEALRALGGEPVEFDLAPFTATAQLLYQGPWVAERYAAIADFYPEHHAEMDPTVATIIGGASKYTAVDAFQAGYKLEALRRATAPAWNDFDVMVLPTAPRAYTHAEIAAAPIALNSHLGTYTNFVNLLDLAAVAVPAGISATSLPFSVSLIGKAFTETALLALADRLQRKLNVTVGGSSRKLADASPLKSPAVPNGCLLMAVVGAHLSGQPLNWQLTQRGGRLVRTCRDGSRLQVFRACKYSSGQAGAGARPGVCWAGDRG